MKKPSIGSQVISAARAMRHQPKPQAGSVAANRAQLMSQATLADQAQRRAKDVAMDRPPSSMHMPMVKRASSSSQRLRCAEGMGAVETAAFKERVDRIQKILKPGDIVTTNPRHPMLIGKTFKAVSQQIQGSRFGHSTMYVGNGDVIESRSRTVHQRPLMDLARCNQFVVHRPDVSAGERRDAVKWIKSQVGNNGMRVTVKNLLWRGMRPTSLAGKHEGTRQERIDSAICSSLVANAYGGTSFNDKRTIANHRPSDIIRSDKVKKVVTFV